MAQYQTEQKRVLLAYMKAHSEESFTIEELCERLKQETALTAAPGKSTVYRIMPKLVEEGLVKRFVKGNGRKFLYQMVCREHCDRHLHMKCSVCGKLYHMEDAESEALFWQVMRKHHSSWMKGGRFCLDNARAAAGRRWNDKKNRKRDMVCSASGIPSDRNRRMRESKRLQEG